MLQFDLFTSEVNFKYTSGLLTKLVWTQLLKQQQSWEIAVFEMQTTNYKRNAWLHTGRHGGFWLTKKGLLQFKIMQMQRKFE